MNDTEHLQLILFITDSPLKNKNLENLTIRHILEL